MKKASFTSLLLLLILVLIPSSAFAAKSAVPTGLSFPDPVLEMIVRHYINKPTGPITQKDVDKITVLDTKAVHAMLVEKLNKPGASTHRVGIRNLKGLSQLRNLKTLRVQLQYTPDTISHTISDLSELKSLKNLKSITLSGVSVESLRGMEDLKGLTSLNLSSNLIKNLEPLHNLTNLEHLDLSWNQLDQGTNGLAPLKNLKNLKTLNLYMNSVKDISPLSGLTRLQELDVDGSGNGDLQALSSLTNLRKLNIGSFNASSLKPLKGMTKLQELSMVYNRVEDLTPLSDMKQLQIIDMSENRVKSLKPLENLKELRIIKASSNQISSLVPLTNMKHLKEVNFANNRLTSMKGLENKKILQAAELYTNVIDTNSKSNASILAQLQKQGSKISYTEFNPFPDILVENKTKSAYAFGKYVDLPAAPFQKNYRMFVPLQLISDQLGAKVHYNKQTQTVTIKDEEVSMVLQVGSKDMKVNGRMIGIDAVPLIKNRVVYVPVRVIGERLGMLVQPNSYGVSINPLQ